MLLCKPLHDAFDSPHAKCKLTFKESIILSYSTAKMRDKAITEEKSAYKWELLYNYEKHSLLMCVDREMRTLMYA